MKVLKMLFSGKKLAKSAFCVDKRRLAKSAICIGVL